MLAPDYLPAAGAPVVDETLVEESALDDAAAPTAE